MGLVSTLLWKKRAYQTELTLRRRPFVHRLLFHTPSHAPSWSQDRSQIAMREELLVDQCVRSCWWINTCELLVDERESLANRDMTSISKSDLGTCWEVNQYQQHMVYAFSFKISSLELSQEIFEKCKDMEG